MPTGNGVTFKLDGTVDIDISHDALCSGQHDVVLGDLQDVQVTYVRGGLLHLPRLQDNHPEVTRSRRFECSVPCRGGNNRHIYTFNYKTS